MAANEPIVRRLEVLSDLYGEFAANPDARVLRWLLQADEARMVEAFIAMEQDEQAGQHGDLLMTFTTPFENPHGHGYLLRGELVKAYREGKEAIEASGTDANWEPPTVKHEEPDIPFLLRTCESFRDHYSFPGNLVLVLRPDSVRDPEAYQLWIHRLATAAPNNVRVMVLDLAPQPGYGELAGFDDKLVVTQEPALDMPAALEEVSRAGGNLDTPGGQYRHLFVQMGNALGEGELERALSLGEAALAIAVAQGWFHMLVPIHMALGTGLSAAGRHSEAMARYEAAELAAAKGETDGPEEVKPVCPQMRLQARLGRGTALIAAGAWSLAAKLFEETAPLAEEQKNDRAVLDCYRLASFCWEQEGKLDEAWRLGLLGFDKARTLDRETLETSTFPYLGLGLMRLTESGPRRGLKQRMEEEIVAVAGRLDWRPDDGGPPPPTSPSPPGA